VFSHHCNKHDNDDNDDKSKMRRGQSQVMALCKGQVKSSQQWTSMKLIVGHMNNMLAKQKQQWHVSQKVADAGIEQQLSCLSKQG